MVRHLGLALVLGLAAGCGGGAGPAPGYGGSVPSPTAQGWIGQIRGNVLTVGPGGTLPAGQWSIEGFAVIPNPVTGQGPVVLVKQGAGAPDYIPVDTDADVADLYQRVTGKPPNAALKGTAGARYLARVGPAVKK